MMTESTELSERELEILRLVATGASNKEIAQKLFISSNTVKVHLRNIFGKIGAASRTEAAMYAVKTGLVRDGLPVVVEAALQPEPVLVESGGQAGELLQAGDGSLPMARRRLYWVAFAALALLVLLAVGLVALFSREPMGQAATSPPVPTAAPRWYTMASMPTARFGLALASYENRIYAIAGETADGMTGAVERYDPVANTWERAGDKPTPVTDASAAVIGGKIYIPGGRLASGAASNDLEIYDPSQDRWTQAASMPVALSAYALAVFEGQLYLFGGWDGRQAVSAVYRYEPESDTWTLKTPLPAPRAFAAAAVSGGKIYLLGGYDGRRALPDNAIYQPDRDDGSQDPWKAGQALPSARYGIGAASLADIIYIVGGEGDQAVAQNVLAYLPQRDEWQDLESLMLNSWSYLGLIPVETRLYVIGGRLDGLPTNQNLAYQAIYTVLFPVVR